jgi:hypothetical protein
LDEPLRLIIVDSNWSVSQSQPHVVGLLVTRNLAWWRIN